MIAGATGVVGTLFGAVVSDWLVRRREGRAAEARQRRAVTAVVGELLDATTVLDLARERRAWWPPDDGPRDRAWVEYEDDLAECLSDDDWHRLRMTYETLRSLGAMRAVPKRLSRPWEPPARRLRWSRRWPDAEAAVADSWQAVLVALEMLREHHVALARPADREPMDMARQDWTDLGDPPERPRPVATVNDGR